MSDDQKSITSLTEYIAVIDGLPASDEERRYIYRGQKDESWGVLSSALRRLQQHRLKHPELLSSLFRGYIHQIIYEVQLRYPDTYSELTALECLAHLQHNRVATGLIDFTYNPLVALWFACETDGETAGKVFGDTPLPAKASSPGCETDVATAGKVFVVNIQPDTIQEVTTKGALEQDLKTFFKRDEQWHLWQPALGNPALDSQRLTVQQSVFLFGAPEVKGGMIEREIIVPHKCKKKILRELDRMGISKKTLFPDLAGFLERNTVESVYNAELAEHYYTEEIRKEKRREPMRKDVQSGNYFQRGNFRVALGKYQESIEDYDRAIELKPGFAEAYSNRGNAKAACGDYDNAKADFKHALTLARQQGNQKVAQYAETKIKGTGKRVGRLSEA